MSLPSLKCCLTVLDKKAWSIDLHRDVSSSLGLSGMLDLDPYSNQNANEDESLTIPGCIIYSSMTAYAKLGNFSYNNNMKQKGCQNKSGLNVWLAYFGLHRFMWF